MQAQYPSCLRQRRVALNAADGIAEFASSHDCVDERTILKLFGQPSLSGCIYRASEFLSFLFQRLLSLGPRLILMIVFPLAMAFVILFAFGKSKKMLDHDKPSNQKVLQFNFIVTCSCFSLVFFTIAVDYSKISRISKSAIEVRRQHTNRHKANTESKPVNLTEHIQNVLVQNKPLVDKIKSRILSDSIASLQTESTHVDLQDQDIELRSNSAVPSLGHRGSLSAEFATNWWTTYAILRLNMHCLIYQLKSTLKVLLQPNRRPFRRGGRHRERRSNHYLWHSMSGKWAKSATLILLITGIVIALTALKITRRKDNGMNPKWLINNHLWTVAVAGFLTLHFAMLLSVAALVSYSPSNISVVRLSSRWMLTLLACLVLQAAVLPDMHSVPDCSSITKIDNGFFAVFTDLERFIDSPILNSIGASKPKVIFLLSSLITAITAAFLYQLNILQMSIGSVGTIFEFLIGVSPIEGVVLLLNMFATQTNFLILIMPFLAKMNESEIFCIFVLMLVKMPSEDDEYWIFQNRNSVDAPNASLFDMKVRTSIQSTYMPQRLAVRSLLLFPLIIMFCRIIYPSGGKNNTRSAHFRRLCTLKDSRPFKSMGESLLFFVAYCVRSLSRYFVMILFIHCMEFLFRFLSTVVSFKIGHATETERILMTLASSFVSVFTDLQLYPSKGLPLSQLISRKFLYPKSTFQELFVTDPHLTEKRNPDPILAFYNEVTMPVKEIVVSGSLSWDTVAVFAAFTTDFLTKKRRTTLGFLVRGCIAAVLIYAAMQNLLYLACKPESLIQIHKISTEWITALKNSANLTFEACSKKV